MIKTKNPKRATATRISEARLQRLTHQNEKLKLEVQRLRGEVGPIEEFKQTVLKANHVVKTQLLALPYRLSSQVANTSDPRECAKLMEEAIVQACNDLAYEREQEAQPGVCPCCGRKKEEEK